MVEEMRKEAIIFCALHLNMEAGKATLWFLTKLLV